MFVNQSIDRSRFLTGLQCELRKEPCMPNPCENSAPCLKQGHSFQCLCPPNKHGKRCELDKHGGCDPNSCDNGGSCQLQQNNSPSGNAYFCLCRPGFYGSRCQTAMDACKPNPCQVIVTQQMSSQLVPLPNISILLPRTVANA